MLSPERRMQYRDRIMLSDQGVEISPENIYGIVSVLHDRGVIDNVNDVEKYADAVKQYAIEHGFTDGSVNASITEQTVKHLSDKLGFKTYGSNEMAIAEEMKAIKDRAITDGTFMKAPNGNPTNLTERQWLQVRTKSFKEWFGDWENDPENASKVIDENGEPLVVYHGSREEFTTFSKDTKNRGSLTSIIKKGFYFSNKNIASQYASSKAKDDLFKYMEYEEGGFSFEEIAEAFGFDRYDDNELEKAAAYIHSLEERTADFGNNLYAVFLNIKNPVVVDLNRRYIGALNKAQRDAINNSEGAIIKNVDETTSRYRGEITIPGMYVGTDYIVFEPNQIKSATDNNGEFSATDDNIERFLMGEKGAAALDKAEEATIRIDNLKVAKEMEQAGDDAKTVKIATGWERGADGKWRHETSDDIILKDGYRTHNGEAKLVDIIENNDTYRYISQSPLLSSIVVRFEKDHDGRYDGGYNPDTNIITIYRREFDTFSRISSILNHETQHAIQAVEGFSPGGGLAQANDVKQSNIAEIREANANVREAYRNLKELRDAEIPGYNELERKLNELIAEYDERNSPSQRNISYKKEMDDILMSITDDMPDDDIAKMYDDLADKYKSLGISDVGSETNLEYKGDVYYNELKARIDELRNALDRLQAERMESINEAKREINRTGYIRDNLLADIYKRFSGEVEARNIEARMNMSPEERRNTLAAETEDVAREDQIFLEESLSQAATNGNTEYFKTKNGEVYGYATPDGKIYLDERVIKPEHPIHEYTHLWDRVVRSKNEALWNRGVELMKQTSLWNEYLNHPEYGQRWIADGKSGKELDDLIASEVHARLVGVEGEQWLSRIAAEKGSDNIIDKLKQWILDFWKELGKTLGLWTNEELNALTIDDFVKMTIRDFAEGNITSKDLSGISLDNVVTQYSISEEEAEKLNGIDKLIVDDIVRNRNINSTPTELTRDRFVFYLRSGVPIAGLKPMIDAIHNASPDKDPYEVLADLALKSYQELSEKYKDDIEPIAVEAAKYTSLTVESLSEISVLPDFIVNSGLSKAVIKTIFYLKKLAQNIYKFVVDLISPQRRFNGYGDVVVYSILLGSRDFVSVRNKIRGRFDKRIAKNIKSSLAKDYIELDNKVQQFFKVDATRDGRTVFGDVNGTKVTYDDISSAVRFVVTRDKKLTGSASVFNDCKSILDLIKRFNAIKTINGDIYIDDSDIDSITRFNVIINELGSLFGMSMNDMLKLEATSNGVKININGGLYSLITREDLSQDMYESIVDVRKGINAIMSFRKTESNKVDNIIKALGDRISVSAKTALIGMQKGVNGANIAEDLSAILDIASNIKAMQNELNDELCKLASDFEDDNDAKNSSISTAKYLSRLNSLYNRYAAVMLEMQKDLKDVLSQNKSLFDDGSTANAIFRGVLDQIEGENPSVDVILNSVVGYINGVSVESSMELFKNMRTKVLKTYYSNISDEHNFSEQQRHYLMMYAEYFLDDISKINRHAGAFSQTRNMALQIANNELAEALSVANLEKNRSMRGLNRLGEIAYSEDGTSSSDFVEKDEWGIPTGYFISEYNMGEFEKEIDKAHDIILAIINEKHKTDIGYPIGSVRDITTLQQKKEFANLFSQWKFHGSKVEYKDGKPIGFCGDRVVEIDLSLYKVGENANISDEEALRNAEEHDMTFNEYDDYNFAQLNELRDTERIILSGHKDGSKLTQDEKYELDSIAARRRLLGSIYNIDGTIKTASELEHVKNFNETTDKLRKLRPTGYNEELFKEDFNHEAESILTETINDINKKFVAKPEMAERLIEITKAAFKSGMESLYTDDIVDEDAYKNPLAVYARTALSNLQDWTRARRFRRSTKSFSKALSRVERKDRGFFEMNQGDKARALEITMIRAAIGVKRVDISRIAISPNGSYVSNEINELSKSLDDAYDNMFKAGPTSINSYLEIGKQALNEILESGDNEKLVSVYTRALSMLSAVPSRDIEGDDIDVVAELIRRVVESRDVDAMRELCNGIDDIDLSIERSDNDVVFDDVAVTELKPSIKKLERELIDSIQSLNEKLEVTSGATARIFEKLIEEKEKALKDLKYEVKIPGRESIYRYRSSLSTVSPSKRRVDVSGLEDEDMFEFGYSNEYIIRSNEIGKPSVRGLVPNKNDKRFVNSKFAEMMSKPATKAFYDAMISKKAELDGLNGITNTNESKLKIPIREVDYRELEIGKSISKATNVMSTSDGNLTDGEYMAIKAKEESFRLRSQAGTILRRAVIPMSRRLEDMTQCSVNMLNSMNEYASRTYILNERLKRMDVTESIIGGMRSGEVSASSVKAQDSINPNNPITYSSSAFKKAVDRAIKNGSIKYDDSNVRLAYDDMIDTMVYNTFMYNQKNSRAWINVSKAIRAICRFASACLIKFKALQSLVNILQVGENIGAEQMSKFNVHSNKIKAAKYMALDAQNVIADAHRLAKRSKVGFLYNIFSLTNSDKIYDRRVKYGPLGATTDVVLSTTNDFTNNGFNMIGERLLSDPSVVERMFDFALVEYVDKNGNKISDIMQEADVEELKANNPGNTSIQSLKFKNLKRLPDLIKESPDGFPDIDERYRDIVERNIGRIGTILRAYQAFTKSAISQDEQGKLFTDPSTQSIFIFRTWILPKFYQYWGHGFTNPVYNFRDKQMMQGCLFNQLARLFVFFNPYKNTANEMFNSNTADLKRHIANSEATKGFLFQILLGAVYSAGAAATLLLASMDPDGDDKKPWLQKLAEAGLIKAASEHFDSTTMLGIIPTFNKVSFADIILYAFMMENVEGGKFLLGELGIGPGADIHKSGEFKYARKDKTLLYNNFVPFSDFLISGNDRQSEIHYLVGNGGAAGLFYQAIQDAVVDRNEVDAIRSRLEILYENEVRTGLGKKSKKDKSEKYIIQYEPNIIAQGLLGLHGVTFDKDGNPSVDTDKYFKDGKLTLVGKSVVASELYKKTTGVGKINSYYGDVDIPELKGRNKYRKEDSNYMKVKLQRMATEILRTSMRPFDTRSVISMDDLVLDGLKYSEEMELKKLKETYKDYPQALEYLIKEGDRRVAKKLKRLINYDYKTGDKALDLLEIDINSDQFEEIRKFISDNGY